VPGSTVVPGGPTWRVAVESGDPLGSRQRAAVRNDGSRREVLARAFGLTHAPKHLQAQWHARTSHPPWPRSKPSQHLAGGPAVASSVGSDPPARSPRRDHNPWPSPTLRRDPSARGRRDRPYDDVVIVEPQLWRWRTGARCAA